MKRCFTELIRCNNLLKQRFKKLLRSVRDIKKEAVNLISSLFCFMWGRDYFINPLLISSALLVGSCPRNAL